MTSHQAGIVLLDLAVIIVLARTLGALAQRIGQPPVIGEILAGIVLGPTLFDGAPADALFPAEVRPFLASLANLGLVLFMFIVGLELDHRLVRGREQVAATVSIGSIALPFLLGGGLGLWLAAEHPPERGVLSFVLFLGAAMSVTAFPVLARILTDRGMHRTSLGGLALACAAVDDVLAWSLLAVVVAVGSGQLHWQIALAVPYVLVMFFVIRPLLARLVPARDAAGRLAPGLLAVVLAGTLVSGWATEWIGVHFIFGAFLFGAVMPRTGAQQLRHEILERLEPVSMLLLLPVFFVVAGLQVDLSGVGLDGLVELAAILTVAIIGKFAGAYAGARLQRMPSRPAAALAVLMNTRGLTEIVILTVGLQLGVLDRQLYSLMVVMAVLTTVMTGPLLRLIYPPERVAADIADAERIALGTHRAHRVVTVVTTPSHAAQRVDLAADLAATGSGPGQAAGLAAANGAVRPGPAEVVLAHLEPLAEPRLEVGTGLSGELAALAAVMSTLDELAHRARRRGLAAAVLSQFSENLATDSLDRVVAADADEVVLAADDQGYAAIRDGVSATVIVLHGAVRGRRAIRVRWSADPDGQAALAVAARLAIARSAELILDDGPKPGRRAAAAATTLTASGVPARCAVQADGPWTDEHDDVVTVAADDQPAVLTVRAARPARVVDLRAVVVAARGGSDVARSEP